MGNDMSCDSRQSLGAAEPSSQSSSSHPLSPSGDTAITLSIKHNYAEALTKLTEHKFGINQPEIRGDYPVHLAVTEKNREALEVLTKHGADVNVKNESGLTPLHLACLGNDSDAVKYLLSNGADPNGGIYPVLRTPHPTPIRLAADNGNLCIVKMLLDYGADPDIVEMFGLTLLIRVSAVRERYQDVASVIVDHSHGFRITDIHGHSALTWAVYTDQCDLLLQMILKMKSDNISLPAPETVSPIILAIHRGCWTCFLNLLKHFGEEAIKDTKPDTLEFCLAHPYWNLNMFPGTRDAVERTMAMNVSLDRIAFAKHILEEFDVQVGERFVQFCVNDTLRMRKLGYPLISLCINASGYFGNVTDESMRLKQEILFEVIVKRGDRDLALKMLYTGFEPKTSNLDVRYMAGEEAWNDQKRELVTELQRMCQNPRTLGNLCAMTVRKCLKGNVIYKAKSLPIPPRLYEMITIGYNDPE